MFDFLPDVPLDFSPSYQLAANIDHAQYGDGYEQSQPAGINHQRRSYSVQATMLTRDEYDMLHDFLAPRLNLTPFYWQPPWDLIVRQWKCTRLGGPRPTSARFASLSATFVEDFTP